MSFHLAWTTVERALTEGQASEAAPGIKRTVWLRSFRNAPLMAGRENNWVAERPRLHRYQKKRCKLYEAQALRHRRLSCPSLLKSCPANKSSSLL